MLDERKASGVVITTASIENKLPSLRIRLTLCRLNYNTVCVIFYIRFSHLSSNSQSSVFYFFLSPLLFIIVSSSHFFFPFHVLLFIFLRPARCKSSITPEWHIPQLPQETSPPNPTPRHKKQSFRWFISFCWQTSQDAGAGSERNQLATSIATQDDAAVWINECCSSGTRYVLKYELYSFRLRTHDKFRRATDVVRLQNRNAINVRIYQWVDARTVSLPSARKLLEQAKTKNGQIGRNKYI